MGEARAALDPATRYMDFLSLGVVANAMALVAMLDRQAARTRCDDVSCGCHWSPGSFSRAAGFVRLADRAFAELDAWKPYFSAHVTNVHRLVVTGDVAGFVAKPPLVELPYPDPNRLAQLPAGPVHPARPAVFRARAAAEWSHGR